MKCRLRCKVYLKGCNILKWFFLRLLLFSEIDSAMFELGVTYMYPSVKLENICTCNSLRCIHVHVEGKVYYILQGLVYFKHATLNSLSLKIVL